MIFLHLSNWLALGKVFTVFADPARFFLAVLSGKAPAFVDVRTPIGRQRIVLRNFQSLRTVFTIFCREDYRTATTPAFDILDLGANIGAASVYFLTRNPMNTVAAYEPDSGNLDDLEKNLAPFGNRAKLFPVGVGTEAGEATLYRSQDGKYSSLFASEKAATPQTVSLVAFADLLRDAQAAAKHDILAKIDVENMEPRLLRSVRFGDYPAVTRLLVETKSRLRGTIDRPHTMLRRAGTVKDIVFTRTEA